MEETTPKISPVLRSSNRSLKRKSYSELKDTDSDFLDDSDSDVQNDNPSKPPMKKRILKLKLNRNKNDSSMSSSTADNTYSSMTNSMYQESTITVGVQDIESPPNGTLPSLWYSREVFIHVWVIEKIIGWKTRPKVELQYKDDNDNGSIKPTRLDDNIARDISEKLIYHYVPRSNTKRMDISRIAPSRCPVVLKAFVDKEERRKMRNSNNVDMNIDKESVLNNSDLSYSLRKTNVNNDNNNSDIDKEEVLLIKWRGKSYLHCSWERPSDLELYDTTNNTAKGKIKRYYQSQQMLLGKDWKNVLEEGKMMSPSSQTHVAPTSDNDIKGGSSSQNDNQPLEDEDYFNPDYVEVERIMACDENEMDMSVLSRQRALNIKSDKDADKRRHIELMGGSRNSDDEDTSFLDEDKPWDEEDNVRYVVKWKGLQSSEITWEYWLFIKHDSVDQAEDFWLREQAPDSDVMKQIAKPHPTMREYNKLIESPSFGLSSRERHITTLDGASIKMREDEETDGLKLRAYQLEGVNWLLWNWWNKRSCILADEMGLGKTIQSLCFLEQLRKLPATQLYGPFLLVAPLSLVNQWQSECATWAPDWNVILYHGSANARKFMFENEFYFTEQFTSKSNALKLKRQHVTKFQLLITTYEVIMKDLSTFTKIRWKALIIDEAHRLKNHQSRLFTELGSVPRDFCLLLTGTPLQNSTEELWSLLNFSDSITFSSKDIFVEKFGQLSDSNQVSELHSVLKPYLLRRVKEDVEKSLPPKEETILEVTLTPIQKTYYKAIYERNTSFLFKGTQGNNAPSLMNVMMELRKCCNHPFLIKGAEERIMNDEIVKLDSEVYTDPILRWRTALSKQLVQSSGKMVLLMKLLPKLQAGGHKVLIFSQMVRVLDLLEELLRLNQYRYERLDGSIRASARHAAVDRFNRKSYQRFVMLLSTRAGGLGLNLTSADTVIIFDSDWNPQNDLQAMARAHRIGQTRAVRVYRLLTAKTYEMHMFHSASMKLGLDRAVLAHQRQNDQALSRRKKTELEKESQAKEIDQLLKKGAYDVFREDDDTEAKLFMETDIDQLLERSSRTVTYGNTETSISKGLGSFSKASFITSDAAGNDIDLDDPDFWAKAVGLDTPEEKLDENIITTGEKRSRKQVQVYDPYASYFEDEQKKSDKLSQKLQQEKEEKKKMKEEQRLKKIAEKEVGKGGCGDIKPSQPKLHEENDGKNVVKEGHRLKKIDEKDGKKRERDDKQKQIVRDMAKYDPIVDRLKPAWESSHRDRVISAVNLFGFGRLCKVRNEVSLLSVPIQDIEVFLRSYIYQLGLQASISLIQCKNKQTHISVPTLISSILDSVDGKWVIDAMRAAMVFHEATQTQSRDMRVAPTLIEPEFLLNLRSGVALSSLYSIAFMSRLNKIMETTIDEIIAAFGNEDLGKRGCYNNNVHSLDVDLKARLVTVEELLHSLGCRLDEDDTGLYLSDRKPTLWWDRECDLALVIGTFYHGLSNYTAILDDEQLPFCTKYRALPSSKCLDDRLYQLVGLIDRTYDYHIGSPTQNCKMNNTIIMDLLSNPAS